MIKEVFIKMVKLENISVKQKERKTFLNSYIFFYKSIRYLIVLQRQSTLMIAFEYVKFSFNPCAII